MNCNIHGQFDSNTVAICNFPLVSSALLRCRQCQNEMGKNRAKPIVQLAAHLELPINSSEFIKLAVVVCWF